MLEINRRALVFGLTALPFYPKSPFQVFSESEALITEALIDCIVPADEYPGAKEAGVIYYLDKQLAGPLARFLPAYRAGVSRLSELCVAKHGKTIAECKVEQLASWLGEVEQTGPADAKTFFHLLVEQTMQGYYGSPQNGGNRDEASWQMLQVAGLFAGHSH